MPAVESNVVVIAAALLLDEAQREILYDLPEPANFQLIINRGERVPIFVVLLSPTLTRARFGSNVAFRGDLRVNPRPEGLHLASDPVDADGLADTLYHFANFLDWLGVLHEHPYVLEGPGDYYKKNADWNGKESGDKLGESDDAPALRLHFFNGGTVLAPWDTSRSRLHYGVQRGIVESELRVQLPSIEYNACLHPETFTNHPPEWDACQRVGRAVLDGATTNIAVTTSEPDLASIGRVARFLCRIPCFRRINLHRRGDRLRPHSRRRLGMVEVGHELGAMFIKGDRMTENSDRRVVSNEVKLFVSYADGCNRIPRALLD